MSAIDVVVMAAGKGTRMKSKRPKVLHRLGGRALLERVVESATGLQPRRIVVVTGHGAEEVNAALHAFTSVSGGPACETVPQEPQLGTGHAVQQALPRLGRDGICLVLNGDVPLIETATLQALVKASGGERLALLTVNLDDPHGYGRIVRDGDGDDVRAIVEEKDASDAQRGITEVYTGFMAVPNALLHGWLGRLTNDNVQGEYYLTDLVALAVQDGQHVAALRIDDRWQVEGVNSPVQLAALERALQRRQADALMEAGVRLADPERIDIRGRLECAADVEIDVNCVFEGEVVLGEGARIGANCFIRNARIDAGAVIHPFTHMDGEKAGVSIGQGAFVGPFARLRPGARLGAEVHIGNFVEVKNSTLGRGAKANHLAYLGDAQVGERVNYGAGSITANYDGAYKHQTVIEADVHVGSNCVLVAPVTLGAGVTVGAGSTITKDTPPGGLAVARGRQAHLPAWQRPKKAK